MLKVIDQVKGIDMLGLLKKTGAVMEGHFRLSSGYHSQYYLQCAKLLQYPKLTSRIVKAGIRQLDADVAEEVDTVVSPAMGGILFGYMIAYHLGKRMVFTERKEKKMELRRGFSIQEGERVLLAEDVITTGGSVREVIEICLQKKAQVLGILSLVDRSEDGGFDYPYRYMAKFQIEKYDPKDCPLCQKGIALDYMGSKKEFQ